MRKNRLVNPSHQLFLLRSNIAQYKRPHPNPSANSRPQNFTGAAESQAADPD